MSDMATLERRLAVLEDIEAIRQLKHRYFFMCDRKRPADVLACFAPGEVRIDYGRIGQFSRAADMVVLRDEAWFYGANGDAPPSYSLGARNFYAITRYNRSSFYAMAVIELAQALRRARDS